MRYVLALVAMVLLTGCATTSREPPVQAVKCQGDVREDMFVTVSSQTELDAFNERYCHPEIKNIDFSSQALVARFLGEKHSGGYWVNLTKVEMGTGSTFVFKVTEPGDSCFVFPAFTYPYYVGIGAHLQSPFAYRDDLEKSTC